MDLNTTDLSAVDLSAADLSATDLNMINSCSSSVLMLVLILV